jgi:hypothetical protein
VFADLYAKTAISFLVIQKARHQDGGYQKANYQVKRVATHGDEPFSPLSGGRNAGCCTGLDTGQATAQTASPRIVLAADGYILRQETTPNAVSAWPSPWLIPLVPALSEPVA